MTTTARVNRALEDLPLDAFDLSADGIQVESLTNGHGMTEVAASCCCSGPWCCCSC